MLSEETSWSTRPETSPDGKQVLFASYHGRQWRQLWLTTPGGAAPLPTSFGDFDRWNARWSPDGQRIAYIGNEHGNTNLVVQDIVGGATTPIVAAKRRVQIGSLRLDIRDEQEACRHRSPSSAATAGRQRRHPPGCMRTTASTARCKNRITLFPLLVDLHARRAAGKASIWVQRGFRYLPWQQTVELVAGRDSNVAVKLPERSAVVARDRLTEPPPSARERERLGMRDHLGRCRRVAEDLDAVYDLIVNKEERVPDIAYFRPGPDPASGNGVLILHSQEFHTSYWGHLGLLGLSDHVLTPGFSAYQNSPLTSPWPHNGVVADLAHAQGALVGYVHPFDTLPDPVNDKSLTNELPADVANGKVDYMEIVGFSDHKATAEVWYRLLNLGYRIPAGAGTDAMANYADLRGPVGMNRVFLDTGGDVGQPRSSCAQGWPNVREQRAAAGWNWMGSIRATRCTQRPGKLAIGSRCDLLLPSITSSSFLTARS